MNNIYLILSLLKNRILYQLQETIYIFLVQLQEINVLLRNIVTLDILIAIPSLLFTISIPLAIFILDKRDTGYPWDTNVLLSKVFNVRKLFIFLLLYFFSLVLWNIPNLQIITTLLLVICISSFIQTTINGYKWIVTLEAGGITYRNKQRLEYLRGLDYLELSIIFSQTWNENKPGVISNRELIEIYVDKIDKLFSDGKIENHVQIIDVLKLSLNKINSEDPVIHELLIKIILKYAFLNKNTPISNLRLSSFRLQSLFEELIRYDIRDNFTTYLLFDDTQRYIKEYDLDESQIAQFIIRNILEGLEKVGDRVFGWENIPVTWKVTIENLLSTAPIVQATTRSTLSIYLNWILKRELLTNQEEQKLDELADEVTRELFPNVDPITWSDIFVFFFAPFGYNAEGKRDEARIHNFVDQLKTFGNIGKGHTYIDEESYEVDYTRSVNEAINIFKLIKNINNEEIRKLLGILESTKEEYKDNRIKYHKIERLKFVLQKLLAI